MSSKIEWTQETWNPIIGCSKVSDGCKNCYAERMACRLAAMECNAYCLVQDGKQWNGKTAFVESALEKPLHWRKPRKVFVCSMGDLFHESVPFEWIDKVFAVMSLCSWHTFQVLTKRPQRMYEYLSIGYDNRIHAIQQEILDMTAGEACWNGDMPMDNVWLGCTCENQKTADERIPWLIKCPAAVRFVSVEPMLSAVSLVEYYQEEGKGTYSINIDYLDWIICGGETGPGAREMDPEWARDLLRQCRNSEIPFFFKQMSKKAEIPEDLMVREWPKGNNNE